LGFFFFFFGGVVEVLGGGGWFFSFYFFFFFLICFPSLRWFAFNHGLTLPGVFRDACTPFSCGRQDLGTLGGVLQEHFFFWVWRSLVPSDRAFVGATPFALTEW